MRGAGTLFFLLFLDCWQGVDLHHPFHLIKGSPQQKSLKNSEFAPRSNKHKYVARLFGHPSEEGRRKRLSLFNRAVHDSALAKRDAQNRTMPCLLLLHFLQRNNLITICSVVGILVAALLLLLMFTIYTRKKQALYRPADMTYNIFIMGGKTWWQKSPKKNTKNSAGKQKLLNFSSLIDTCRPAKRTQSAHLDRQPGCWL